MRTPNEQGNLGKYDEMSELVLKCTQARMVAVIVVGGGAGDGFSVSMADLSLADGLPDFLEAMAQSIREQNKGRVRS